MTSSRIIIAVIVIIIFIPASVLLRVYWLIPDRKSLTSCFTTTMFQVELCPGSKNYVYLNQISKHMQRTIVLTEDSLFFEHKGFDWQSIEKSAKENLKGGKIKRGGSTITQQLAKNLFLTKDKTLVRKVVEALLTLQIEKHLTKREILEKYLNVVEFGKNIYGIKAASWHYFKKAPSQLDVVESAFLAMLLPNPIKYSRSFYNKQLSSFAFRRIKRIITDMYEYNRIGEDEFMTAKSRLKSFFTSPEQVEEIDNIILVDESEDEETEDEKPEDADISPDTTSDGANQNMDPDPTNKSSESAE